MYRLHLATTDDFDDVGEGSRQNGEIWFRTDLNQIRAKLNGVIYTLFDSDGTVGANTLTATGTLTIASTDANASTIVTDVGFKPSMVYFIAKDDADATCSSNGWACSALQACTSSEGALASSSFTYAIDVSTLVVGAETGWRSAVTFATTIFTLTNTKLGVGKNVTIKYVAIK